MKISTTFPEPRGLKLAEWGAVVAEQLASSGVSAPHDENDWKAWVSALHQVPSLVSMNIPGPDGFDSWQDWAERFIGSVR